MRFKKDMAKEHRQKRAKAAVDAYSPTADAQDIATILEIMRMSKELQSSGIAKQLLQSGGYHRTPGAE